MRSHVALLRGINVSGRNKVSMRELRDVVMSLGHRDVTTYIQSGNVVFSAAETGAASIDLADALEGAIEAQLAVRTPVVVVSRSQLRRVIGANPFPNVGDPKHLHAVFLRVAPNRGEIASVTSAVERARAKGCGDEASVVGRALYLLTPGGFARSTLRAELSRGGTHRTPMQAGTARNWATVTALDSLIDG